MKNYISAKKITALLLCVLMAVLPFSGAFAVDSGTAESGIPAYITASGSLAQPESYIKLR